MHNSHRSASVTAENYGTIGSVDLETMYWITNEFKGFKRLMLQHMLRYRDSVRLFLISVLKERMPYLYHASEATISTLAYNMKMQWLEPGSPVFNAGDISQCLFIILQGKAEVYTEFDNGIQFTIERLERGAVVGQYTFLMEDKYEVSVKCTTPCCLYVLSKERF